MVTTGTEYVPYNSEIGAKASTTGNIHGVYDMRGGYSEYVAGFNEKGDSNQLTNASYGLNMTKEAKDVNGNYISTKYITKYSNGTNITNSVTKIREVSKIGEGMKEVRLNNDLTSWFGNGYSNIVIQTNPFICRGGGIGNGVYAGVFCSADTHAYKSNVFRVCLGL